MVSSLCCMASPIMGPASLPHYSTLTYQNLLFCRAPMNSILGFILRTSQKVGFGRLRYTIMRTQSPWRDLKLEKHPKLQCKAPAHLGLGAAGLRFKVWGLLLDSC